ncbi:MAG: hypothetical protein NPMRTH1_1250023 [Nitrosopumilales archaeon]|nr:MAG: hypothetical protein NPMRTH1_1250023 [Nitrosopumilales archaeon]
MNEREEIRWKFQVMLENTSTVMNWAENQRKILVDFYKQNIRDVEKVRNYWIAGIGFGITIFAPLIAIGAIELFYSFYLIVAGLVAIGLFMVTNNYIFKKTQEQDKINVMYFQAINGEMLPLKGMISTLALNDDQKTINMITLQNYIHSYTKAISYDVSFHMSKTMKLDKFDDKPFRESYEYAKQNLELFSKSDYETGVDRIKKFIEDFEKNEK